MMSPDLLNLISQTVEVMPQQAVRALISELDQADNFITREQVTEETTRQLTKISQNLPNAASRYTVEKLLEAWQKDKSENKVLTLRELATAIEILAYQKAQQGKQKLELVWTGPASKIPVRQTRQVLSQLINGANEELLIVSFVVFNIPEILSLLKEALLRGVKITCIFESPEESQGKITFQGFDAFNEDVLKQIKILIWEKEMRPVNTDGKFGTLHAKCAVADRRISFISSANLTVNAMTLNMELGLLIYDENIAQEIVDHFEHLTVNGVLRVR